ncbi:hypothetical protein EV175_005173 [Coemansia sp. RSA 1933]|nr:hypothetical protein EV175_005173 [Coemansia sp. RSA 1933]
MTSKSTIMSVRERIDLINLLRPLKETNVSNELVLVRPWFEHVEENLHAFNVQQTLWVDMAINKIPIGKASEFRTWCTTKKRERNDWNGFKEFLVLTYCDAINRLDACARIARLTTPKTAAEFETVLESYKLLCKRAGYDVKKGMPSEYFATKMPSKLVNRLIMEASTKKEYEFDVVVAMARAFFAAEDSCNVEPMQVDAIRTRPHGRNLPAFKYLKEHCTKQEYEDRAERGVCLGCGEKHRWAKCKLNEQCPKDSQN